MKPVLITGANKGIGLATVSAMLEQRGDTHVLLGSRDAARGQSAIDQLVQQRPDWSSRLELVELDVARDDSVAAALQAITARHGSGPSVLHGIVNNAGIGFGSNDVETVLNVNVLGVKRVCDAFTPLLEPGGRVVNVSSASAPNFVSQCSAERRDFFINAAVSWDEIENIMTQAVRHQDETSELVNLGLGELSAYGFSKACVSLYTLLLAREHPQLTINACTPGYIETDLTRPAAEARGMSPTDLGMKSPAHGTVAILHLLFDQPHGSGHYYGSDAKRSPMDHYRAPGDPEYMGP